jgi:Domain of unknown function (DUF4304)
MAAFAASFSQQLRQLVVPAFADAGFVFDGSRTFRRFPQGTPCAQIVNFQLGERFMEGKFTVNLAVYDPDDASARVEPKKAFEYHCSARLRQRLGVLLPTPLGTFARLPVFGFLFLPRDKWWRADAPKAMDEARDAIFAYGLAWLESNTPPKAIER